LTALAVVVALLAPPPVVAVQAFRAELADPARHPVRTAKGIDTAYLLGALKKAAEENHAALTQRWEASLALGAETPPPKAPTHTRRCATDPQVLQGLAQAAPLYWMRAPDATQLAQQAMGMTFPICATQGAGMSSAQVGAWMGFLSAAQPAVRRCGTQKDALRICLDYGGRDIVVVGFAQVGRMWAPALMEWWQATP
jgi:hypothetical protein